MKNIIKNLFYLFLPLVVGIVVGLIINGSIFYSNYLKPPLAPPSFLFPIVWTILYFLMGLSFYLLNKDSFVSDNTKLIYYLQLIVNALWSIIFFVLNLKFLAILWIILLVILIIIMIIKFFNINKLSAYLNIPYLIWCIFATYLTIGIYVLN